MSEATVIDCVELRATLPQTALADLEGLLWLLSPNGIQVEDALCLSGGDLADAQVRVHLYVAPAHAAGAIATLRRQAERLGIALDVAATAVAAQDWNRVWKQHYKPIQLGPRLRIEPAWEQGQDQPGLVRIAIDPGMAFGTGTHETTQLCAEAIVAWADARQAAHADLAGLTVLDLGTGSAILAILAVKLGVGGAIGTEVDAAALGSARTNLALNGVQDRVTLLHSGDPGAAGSHQYPLVIANILASVLVPLRDAIVDRVAPGGLLVLSGILAREAQEVADHYAEVGLTVAQIATSGAWAGITLSRPQ